MARPFHTHRAEINRDDIERRLRAAKDRAGRAREETVRAELRHEFGEHPTATLIELGGSRFVEIGPGKVLTGLMRRIDRDLPAANVEDPASLEAFQKGL